MRLLPLIPVLLAAGWRHDGSSQVPDAAPDISWTLADASWRVALPGSSNASPVRFGELVCFSVEPVTTTCLRADSGELAWSAESRVVDMLPEPQRAAGLALVEAADKAAKELEGLTSRKSGLQRDARRKVAGAAEALAVVDGEIAAATAAMDAAAAYRTPPLQKTLGWSSPTPVTDGELLYTFFANGVVSAFAPDGTRRWAVWLGERSTVMEFYPGVPTASPVLAGGRLVVAYDRLVGLDPASGAQVWSEGSWVAYGSPTVAQVDGLTVLLTPDGRVVRASDGVRLVDGLGVQPWFNDATYEDGVAWWVGGRWREDVVPNSFRAEGGAWRLRREGDGVVAEALWRVDVPGRDRFYASPLIVGDRLLAIDNTGHLNVLDKASGALVQSRVIDPKIKAQVWASPVLTASGVMVAYMDGTIITLGPELTEIGRATSEPGLAVPAFQGASLWLRSHAALVRVDAKGRPPG